MGAAKDLARVDEVNKEKEAQKMVQARPKTKEETLQALLTKEEYTEWQEMQAKRVVKAKRVAIKAAAEAKVGYIDDKPGKYAVEWGKLQNQLDAMWVKVYNEAAEELGYTDQKYMK